MSVGLHGQARLGHGWIARRAPLALLEQLFEPLVPPHAYSTLVGAGAHLAEKRAVRTSNARVKH